MGEWSAENERRIGRRLNGRGRTGTRKVRALADVAESSLESVSREIIAGPGKHPCFRDLAAMLRSTLGKLRRTHSHLSHGPRGQVGETREALVKVTSHVAIQLVAGD
jgi:hypothetical protein